MMYRRCKELNSVEAKIIEDKLHIRKINSKTKETIQEEVISICTIISGQKHSSNIIIDEKLNMILLMQQLNEKDICVWCTEGNVFYKIASTEKLYETLGKDPYKIVQCHRSNR